MNNSTPQVCIVDDDIDVCKSLCYLLKSINIDTKYYTDPNQFLKHVTSEAYECILIDIRMPNVSGLVVAEQLKKNNINTPVVFITGHADVEIAVDAMKSGAYDFITKPVEGKKITRLVMEAMQLNQSKKAKDDKTKEIQQRIEQLSNREKQIVKYVIHGKSSQEIADELHISLKTVESHRYRILKKMQVSSTVQLTGLLAQTDGIFA